MGTTLTTAVALVLVAVSMLAVCEHAEVCRLRYRVWEAERRRDSLERQTRELDADLEGRRTPKRLLEGLDLDRDGFGEPASNVHAIAAPRPIRFRSSTPRPAGEGRRDLRWFEFDAGAR